MDLNIEKLEMMILNPSKTLQFKLQPITHTENQYSKEIKESEYMRTHKKKGRVARIEPAPSISNSQNFDINSQQRIFSDYGFTTPTKKIVEGYSGKTTYVMGSINSIALHNNLIYDLLEPVNTKEKKTLVKCKCTQSKCKSGYCQCYSRGLVCGVVCQCSNCQNISGTQPPLAFAQQQGKGCRCQKSQCGKKYCECLKQGNKCSDKCQCIDCHNL